MVRQTFARRLKALRKAAGLSQYAVAKRTGLSPQAISYLEAGDRDPNWSTVCLLADALGVEVGAFVVKPEPKKKPK